MNGEDQIMKRESVVENAVALAEINNKFDKVMQTIEYIKEKQEEVAADVAHVKDAVYNPDLGLYARLRELENWKKASSRLLWVIITSIATLTVAAIYRAIL
jgi:endonuclease IV